MELHGSEAKRRNNKDILKGEKDHDHTKSKNHI